jgi:hypothetical protein
MAKAKRVKRAQAARAGKAPRGARTAKSTEGPATRVVITLSGDRAAHEVTADLRSAGLHVDHVLDVIGSVTGSSHPKGIARLRRVRGVADVSPDHPVDIGPPGAPIS